MRLAHSNIIEGQEIAMESNLNAAEVSESEDTIPAGAFDGSCDDGRGQISAEIEVVIPTEGVSGSISLPLHQPASASAGYQTYGPPNILSNGYGSSHVALWQNGISVGQYDDQVGRATASHTSIAQQPIPASNARYANADDDRVVGPTNLVNKNDPQNMFEWSVADANQTPPLM
jgi:hypothetical protein